MEIEGVLCVPDKSVLRYRIPTNLTDVEHSYKRWEYPFSVAWDTAFQSIPLAVIDPALAKKQLQLLLSDSYMKLDGQIPASEWNFGDVNPPVHAW